jgi:hypothetical protein
MSASNTPADETTPLRPAERDWFGDEIKLFDAAMENGRTMEAVAAAAGIWTGYPLFGEAIECLRDATADEKYKLRYDLDFAHHKATTFLMMEAEREGLNGAALWEASRVCQELFKPIRGQGPASSPYGVEWFHHPSRTFDTWPDCLGEWRYTLPPAMQEAIRRGEEVFYRLMARFSIAPAGVTARTPTPSPKRSTEPGEARAKLIAALTKHHRYADGSCLNTEPIGNNELARLAGVSESTASAFFNDKFRGHAKYKVLCRDPRKLTAALKLLNDEFAPYYLLGNASSELAAPEEDDADSE